MACCDNIYTENCMYAYGTNKRSAYSQSVHIYTCHHEVKNDLHLIMDSPETRTCSRDFIIENDFRIAWLVRKYVAWQYD